MLSNSKEKDSRKRTTSSSSSSSNLLRGSGLPAATAAIVTSVASVDGSPASRTQRLQRCCRRQGKSGAPSRSSAATIRQRSEQDGNGRGPFSLFHHHPPSQGLT